MNGIGTRIEEVAKAVGGKRALANKTGIHETQLYRYISEANLPSASGLVLMAKEGGVSLDWLLTGEGPKLTSGPDPANSHQNPSETGGPVAAGADSIDQDLLGDVVYILEDLQQREGEDWGPAAKAELIVAVYDYLYHEETPTEQDRERVSRLIQSIVKGVSGGDKDEQPQGEGRGPI